MERKAFQTFLLICTLTCIFGLASCTAIRTTSSTPKPTDNKPVLERVSPEVGERVLAENAQRKRDFWKNKTFDQFKATVYREPFEGGKYIVNGDTPVLNEKQLAEFFETRVKSDDRHPLSLSPAELAVYSLNGTDIVWNSVDKRKLTYCVSTNFGNRRADVVKAMQEATGAWEAVADVRFTYTAAQDASCTANNQQVVFDVRPVNVSGEYLARAFFPNDPRKARNILIDESAFGLDPGEKLTLTGILRHELGHTLGFRHEHTRPEAGKCYEDANWRPLTNYDGFSVMHYPQCNGRGDWSLTMTDLDKNGAACIYGAAPGFTIDPAVCPSPGGAGSGPVSTPPQTERFTNQHVNRDEVKRYGPFSVSPGTLLKVEMVGEGSPGDPDVYVRYKLPPTQTRYNCRPYLVGAEEICSLDVPKGVIQAHVMVRGYSAGNYSLTVVHVPNQ